MGGTKCHEEYGTYGITGGSWDMGIWTDFRDL
jgi:hypothetical protein